MWKEIATKKVTTWERVTKGKSLTGLKRGFKNPDRKRCRSHSRTGMSLELHIKPLELRYDQGVCSQGMLGETARAELWT